MTTNNPIEVARETLKQLSTRKLLPTPENYERVYQELTKTPIERENKLAAQLLRALETLPNDNVAAKAMLQRMQQLIKASHWEQVPQLVIDFAKQSQSSHQLAQEWGSLIENLIKSWDLRQADFPQHFKQAGLERLLITYGKQPQELNKKLTSLIQTWNTPLRERDLAVEETAVPQTPSATAELPASWSTWQRILCFALKHGLEPRLLPYPDLVLNLEAMIGEVDKLTDEAALNSLLPRLRAFMIKVELYTQQEGRLVTGLSNLLKLLLDNIAEVNRSDSFMVGQIVTLQEVLSQEPLSMQQIYQLETSLKEVIRKQGALKNSLDEAASSLRNLLDRFVSRLASMTDSTDEFHSKISTHSTRLREIQNVEDLTPIISSLMEDTSTMQLNLTKSRDELLSSREQVESAEQRIKELETALEAASAKVKEDQLTGAYNRRGLAEHFQREISRAERTNSPLSVALIDVDNFKQLNDHYGHLTGDDALKHLVNVTRHTMRPSDIVARFGGEEFVILLPDTPAPEAIQAIQRLQRELTKTFFLANNDRLLITFSAGVAKWHLGERDTDVIERADQAMYQAKITGKNRVCSAEADENHTPV